MGSLSRSQLLVYGAVAVALLLVGRQLDSLGRLRRRRGGGVSYSSASGSSSGSDGDLAIDPNGRRGRGRRCRRRGREPGRLQAPGGIPGQRRRQAGGRRNRRADPESINLAARLADGQQVVVPGRADGPGGVAVGAAARGLRDRGADQPRDGDRRGARHDRGDRSGHRPGHRRLPRSARGRLVGRRARSDRWHRAGDHGRPPRPAPALSLATRKRLGASPFWVARQPVWRFRRSCPSGSGLAALVLVAACAASIGSRAPRGGRAPGWPWVALARRGRCPGRRRAGGGSARGDRAGRLRRAGRAGPRRFAGS